MLAGGKVKVRYENIIPVLGIIPYYTLAIKNQISEVVVISDTVIAVRRSDLLGLHTAPTFFGKHCNMHRTHTVLPSGTPLWTRTQLYSEESKGRISILYWKKARVCHSIISILHLIINILLSSIQFRRIDHAKTIKD